MNPFGTTPESERTYVDVRDASYAVERRLTLIARVIGSCPDTAAYQPLSDDDRSTLEEMTLEAAEAMRQIFDAVEWLERRADALAAGQDGKKGGKK